MKVTIINSDHLGMLENFLHETIMENNRHIEVLDREAENRRRCNNLNNVEMLSEIKDRRSQITALRFSLAHIKRFSTEIEI
jgi:hypothetical protein